MGWERGTCCYILSSLTQRGRGEHFFWIHTRNPHHLIFDSVIDPKARVGESISSGFTHNPQHLILDSEIDPKG